MRSSTIIVFQALTMVASLLLSGCSSGPKLINTSSGEKPVWLDSAAYRRGEDRFYVGQSVGAQNPDQALELAFSDALRALVQEIGVTVSEESKAIQREVNGEFSSNVLLEVTTSSQPVKVRNLKEAGRYVETWSRGGTTEFDGWVLVQVPEIELSHALRMAGAKVLLIWECQSDQPGPCPEDLIETVRAAVTDAGRPLLPDTLPGPRREDPVRLGIAKDAAHVLIVRVSAGYLSESNGEHFATGRGGADLLETVEGKVVVTIDTGDVKGGHFSKEKAVEITLADVFGKLASDLKFKLIE